MIRLSGHTFTKREVIPQLGLASPGLHIIIPPRVACNINKDRKKARSTQRQLSILKFRNQNVRSFLKPHLFSSQPHKHQRGVPGECLKPLPAKTIDHASRLSCLPSQNRESGGLETSADQYALSYSATTQKREMRYLTHCKGWQIASGPANACIHSLVVSCTSGAPLKKPSLASLAHNRPSTVHHFSPHILCSPAPPHSSENSLINFSPSFSIMPTTTAIKFLTSTVTIFGPSVAITADPAQQIPPICHQPCGFRALTLHRYLKFGWYIVLVPTLFLYLALLISNLPLERSREFRNLLSVY